MSGKTVARRPGFTLIELLVVVSVIALLIGILLPALAKARREAERVVCAAMQRQLITGMLLWSSDNQDLIPGRQTSGLDILNTRRCQDALTKANRDSFYPVQDTDWVSPSLGDQLPTDRNERFWAILNNLRCPSQKFDVPIWAGSNDCGAVSARQFVNSGRDRPLGVSYLMPASWQHAGRELSTGGFGNARRTLIGMPFNGSPVSLPSDWFPRLTKLGEPSRKAAFADGFRYFDQAAGVTNIDASLITNIGNPVGTFMASSPIFFRERSYGTQLDPGRQRNLPLTFRHDGDINAAFFDGHVERLTQTETRNPELWFPARSVFTGDSAEPESLRFMSPGSTIN